MTYNSGTITDEEVLEFKRLAMAYELDYDHFDIKERYIPGNSAVTRIEVLYEPIGLRREYERRQNSSWLTDFGEDLASGRFSRRAIKKRTKKAPSQKSQPRAAATSKRFGRKQTNGSSRSHRRAKSGSPSRPRSAF